VKRFCRTRWEQLLVFFIFLFGVLILETYVISPRQRFRPIRTFDTSKLYILKEKTATAVNPEPISGKPKTPEPKHHYGGECEPQLNKA